MADELVQLPNPDNVPGAVSTGYQRQNVNLLAGQTGLDLTAPYVSGATIVLPVGGIIDVNGVLYKIEAEAILTPANLTDAWYIYLEVGTGTAFTPKLTTNPGTFNAAKNARYTASNERILNWVYSHGIHPLNPANGAWYVETSRTKLAQNRYLEWSAGVISRRWYPKGSTIYHFSRTSGGLPYTADVPVANTAISGICIDPATGNLIVSDNTTYNFTDSGGAGQSVDMIYVYDRTGQILLYAFAAPATSPGAITVDSATGNLISGDNGTDRIYIHDGISATVLSSFVAPGTGDKIIRGLFIDIDTGNLVSCIYSNDGLKFYIHSGITSTVLSSFSYTAETPGNDQNTSMCRDPFTGDMISSRYSIDGGGGYILIHDGISNSIKMIFNRTASNSEAKVSVDPITGNLFATAELLPNYIEVRGFE